jgi:diadenosine tetraphosphate (Ap4A) HIT family hydrolase
MTTLFTLIIEGELPGTFVWRDERAVAFLSINPMAPGHTLVVPVAEVAHWIDLDTELVAHLTAVAHELGRAQQRAFGCERVGLIVAGYEVPHVHLHVIPTSSMDQLAFANAARSVTPEELSAAADRIRAELRAAGRPEVSD